MFNTSIKILSFPFLVISVLITANLISNVGLHLIFELDIVWFSLLISGLLNISILRSFIMTDKVQTESKHHINKIRGLYLNYFNDFLPKKWQPQWKSKNEYLERKVKLKSANLVAFLMGAINSVYIGLGIYNLTIVFTDFNVIFLQIIVIIFCFIVFSLQQQYGIELLNKILKRRKEKKNV